MVKKIANEDILNMDIILNAQVDETMSIRPNQKDTISQNDTDDKNSWLNRALRQDDLIDNWQQLIQKIMINMSIVSQSDELGNTPLHYLANWKSKKDALSHSKDINWKKIIEDAQKQRAMFQTMIRVITACGAKINAVNHQGDTPLHIASANNPEIVHWLLMCGADRTILNRKGETPQEIFEKKFIGIAWDEITPEINKITHQLIKKSDNNQGINCR